MLLRHMPASQLRQPTALRQGITGTSPARDPEIRVIKQPVHLCQIM
jgi:hypothetical protein